MNIMQAPSTDPGGPDFGGRDRKPVWMYLKRTKQLGIFQDTTKEGVRVKHIGVVPFSEIRAATDQEINDWLSR